jgi:hypothetical protein
MINIEREYTSTDDLHYFIEKLRNKGKGLTVALYSESNEPKYVQDYAAFMEQYIGFTLTNISGIYSSLAEWIKNNPTIRDKIQIIDSNEIGSEVFSYVTAYLNKKLIPSVNSIALSLLGISNEKTVANFETHNIPALAFISPPGTSKTYSIVAELKELSKGQGNSIIAGWLHYDVTKHEATTSPLVLPTANQDIKDEPLPGLAILRASGNIELDKALRENIYTKTVNKIITTFAHILTAGHEKGKISLSNEVESTLKRGVDLNSIEFKIWKLAVTDTLDKENVKELLSAFRNLISGFAKVTKVLKENESCIHTNADCLINAISNIKDNNLIGSPDPEKYVHDFLTIALILHKLITFGLVPIITYTFRNFIITKKLDKITSNNDSSVTDKRMEILDGVMYIYNKIHNNYLHRIISTVFLIKALLKNGVEYENLFEDMITKLNIGLFKLLNNYYDWINNSTDNSYLDLENRVSVKDLDQSQEKIFDFYNRIYMFLINAQPNEKNEYIVLDKMFMETILGNLVGNTENKTSGSKLENVEGTEISQYRGDRVRQYTNIESPEAGFDYFSDNKLSFTDHVRLLSDIINDLYEVRRFYSNVSQNNPSSQEGKTTLEKLQSEFGTRFLDFTNTTIDDVPYVLSVVFDFIDIMKKELTKKGYGIYESIYEDKEYMRKLHYYNTALKDLFTKSLNVITYSPRYGYLINNPRIKTEGINISELIGGYILSALSITDSLRIKGVNYSFPPAVQIFLLRAKQAYYKYLRELRAMIEANMKRMDQTDSAAAAITTLRPPLFVLFIDEIMTQMTPENFLFWLNIWNGLISPANPTVDTYPPNLCFILAGNMPWSTFILGQALSQSSSEMDYQTFMKNFQDQNISNLISVDTINALGSRISLRVVAYDYTYLLRTDESMVRERTALFIRALTKGLLRREDLIRFGDNAQNLLGGFYDYYRLIVVPRLEKLTNLKLNVEKKMKLHAYIASLTAAPDNIPFNINNIVPNSTIGSLIRENYRNYFNNEVIDEVIKKATILNYLFNTKTFGKTIYEYMFGEYFNNDPKEADYFNRIITIAISPIVFHLSFLHSYLTWNNMMRRVAQNLLNKAQINQDNSKIHDAVAKLMKVVKDASKLLNTKMLNADSIAKTLGTKTDTKDRLDFSTYKTNRNLFVQYLTNQGDPRYCDPEVGAVISLLSLVFYHYIKYMKEFNKDISKSIIEFCNKVESIITKEAAEKNKPGNEAQNMFDNEDNVDEHVYIPRTSNVDYVQEFTDLKYKIYNYFVDSDKDINSREDLLMDASEYAYDLSESVRINLLSFNPNKTVRKVTVNEENSTLELQYPADAHSSITVTLIPTIDGSNTARGLDADDIKAIKALVAYTIYTHSLVSKRDKGERLHFSQSLIDNILVSNANHAPLVGHLALKFFRDGGKSNDGQSNLFLIDPLREMDRWFTNVTGSIVKYVTIMTILRHILTYRYSNMPDLMKDFMQMVKNSNLANQRVIDKLENILHEFAELLFEARQAVFTPLANGGEQNKSNHYIQFDYEYNDRSGKIYEGYYTKPDNLVNFGPLRFVFEKLKDLNIVQYDSSNNNTEGGVDKLINTISERFVQYLKNKSQKTTTSFFPIHLISHIELEAKKAGERDRSRIPLEFNNISSLLYQNERIDYITPSDLKTSEGELAETRHHSFYKLTGDAYSISGLIQVLNSKLESIESLKIKFDNASLLHKQNQELIEASASEDSNFIELLYTIYSLTNKYQFIQIGDGIFEDLEKVKSRYPSIVEYLELWRDEKEKNNIIRFFRNLLASIAQNNLNNLSKTVANVVNHLDEYIVEAARRMLGKVKDKKIREMLEILSSKESMNEYIKNTIENIMNDNDLEKYIATSIDIYRSAKSTSEGWNERIEYQIMILEPLIKYSLSIILSNIILLEESTNMATADIDKQDFYNKLGIAIKNSYNKTIRDSNDEDTAKLDYLSMIIRYIFFDMNREEVDRDGKIIISAHLIERKKEDLKNLVKKQNVSYASFHLVRPFFTNYEENTKEIEQENQNGKNVIKKREVFTQYVYTEDGGIPVLYCDIHHIPIRGIQEIDGTVQNVPPKITIYSSEAFKSNKPGYTYTQLTFIRNMALPRYEFAKSALVNLLLIAGIQEIQKYLSNVNSMFSSFRNARFAPFAITNLYHYYKEEISKSNLNTNEFINKVIEKRNSGGKHKYLHPLLASIILSFNKNDENVKGILQNDYGLQRSETYSRRDDFINELRLRFYSVDNAVVIQNTEYDMYSIYEPGVSIHFGAKT